VAVTGIAIAAICAVACGVLAAILLPPLLRRRRRRKAFERSLPDAMRAAMERNVALVNALPEAERRRLEALVIAVLDEKQFVGCNGLEITDEIRVTIAAQACLLLLGRPRSLYDELQSILVYPSAFFVEDEVHDEAGVVERRRRELSGEAWDSHRIILSWEDIADTAQRPADGYNVVLHEFAHYLDAEGLGLAPRAKLRAQAWAEAMNEEYEALAGAVERGEETFLDPYGAEDETEFFAVATEEFIECSADLAHALPRLYALMCDFYGIDPAQWGYEPAAA
jgi:Mlc titration factor MtfA (ptsG expression regulator)